MKQAYPVSLHFGKSIGNAQTLLEREYNIMMSYSKRFDVKIVEKRLLTLEEAAALYEIGINKLRRLSDKEDFPFVLWNGSKRLK